MLAKIIDIKYFRHHFTGLDNTGFIFALKKKLKYFLDLIYMLIISYNIYRKAQEDSIYIIVIYKLYFEF